MSSEKQFKWNYIPVGGVVRVKLDSGEAVAHLNELDKKKWTVLSCPVDGLEFDPATLRILDSDKDGKIHADEVIAASKWLTSLIKNKDLLLEGNSELPLNEIDDSTPEGEALLKSARQILSNLGKDKESISIEDSSDSVAIFAKTVFNGDGIIIPASAGDDEELSKLITNIIEKFNGVDDRSGEKGVDEAKVNDFFTAASDYSAWCASAEADKANVYPYGDNTAAALASYEALKDKISDFFLRCKLISFDNSVASAVDVNAERVAAIGDRNLVECLGEISSYPIARPGKDGTLHFDAINPAWQAAFATFKSLVLDVDFKGATSIDEAQWKVIGDKFTPYVGWLAAKKGAEVESLGLEYVNAVLANGSKEKLIALIAQDKALEAESASIDKVGELLHLYRYFVPFLRNYVVFSEFYSLNPDEKAMFEAGELYIDERCCKLCIRVSNMGAQADMAGLSGMFLIYCTCTSKTLGKTMDIVAVMTDGGTKNLRVGKNAIFYDRQGNDWDAVVTKIVDNPINVKQAFFAPYRKFVNFISEKVNKSASEKDSAATADLLAKADNINVTAPADGQAPKPAFDIAKFAGIFAAIGMALGFIGDALVTLASGISSHPWWQTMLAIVAIMLVISGPSCFLAWTKLRKRNLGPVLNANGWAINSIVKVNVIFGKTLTSTAKYPIVKMADPFVQKKCNWKRCLIGCVIALAVAAGVLWLTGVFDSKEEIVEPAGQEQVEIPAEDVFEVQE